MVRNVSIPKVEFYRCTAEWNLNELNETSKRNGSKDYRCTSYFLIVKLNKKKRKKNLRLYSLHPKRLFKIYQIIWHKFSISLNGKQLKTLYACIILSHIIKGWWILAIYNSFPLVNCWIFSINFFWWRVFKSHKE